MTAKDNFEINGSQPNPSIENQVIDTIQVPFWDGIQSILIQVLQFGWISGGLT